MFPQRSVAESSFQFASVSLFFIWVIGLLLGWFAASACADMLQTLIPALLLADRSPAMILLPTLLPFLLSAFAVYFSLPWLLAVFCGLKAFSFGFCGFGLCMVYGQCSWLIRLLYMFTDICSLPVLYFYWLRYLCGGNRPYWVTNLCFLSILMAICCIDRCVISPFAVRLLLN